MDNQLPQGQLAKNSSVGIKEVVFACKLHVQQLRCYAELHQICFASSKFHRRESPGISLVAASYRSPTSSVWIGIAKVAITNQLRLHKSDISASNSQATIASHQFQRMAHPITDQHHRLCSPWLDLALLAIAADSTIASRHLLLSHTDHGWRTTASLSSP